MSQSIAKLRSARVSSQKARLVANQIRGKKVEEAMGILTFAPQKSALIIKKVLESAIANAEHNHGADIDELRVSTVEIRMAPTLARHRARAKGRGTRVLKRNSHITVQVEDEPVR